MSTLQMSVNRDTDEGSTVANGGHGEELNNSLVFRNDVSITENMETQADSPFEDQAHKHHHSKEGNTQEFNNGESTFLMENDKSDHFFDNLPQYNNTILPPPSSSSNEVNHNIIDTSNILQDVPKSPVNLSQRVKDISLLGADTQVIAKPVSSVNATGNDDIMKSTQFGMVGDTQVIRPITSTKESILFLSDEAGRGSTSHKSFDFRTPLKPIANHENMDVIDTSNIDDSTIIDPEEDLKTKLVQVPSTVERVVSHRQVLNTQESATVYVEDVANSTEISVLEVSKFGDDADVEVHSDLEKAYEEQDEQEEEEEEEEEDPSLKYLQNPYEDSLLTNKLKKRKLNTAEKHSSSSEKAFLTDTKSITESSTSMSKAMEISVLNNTPSSPVTATERLRRRPRTSTSTSTAIASSNGSVEFTVPEILNSFDDISSEIEDIDIDEELRESANESKGQNITAKRRRKNFVVDTQSQSATIEAENGNDENSQLRELRCEQSEVLSEENVKHRNSVWASYNLKMYPGTLVEPGNEISKIEFDEGVYDIKNVDLHLLDIRIGDLIRIKSSRSIYLVTGLTYDECITGIKCVRGYNVVQIRRAKGKIKTELTVLLSECFMEVSEWINHQQNFRLILEDRDVLEQASIENKSIIVNNKTFEDHEKSKVSSPVTSTRTSPSKNSIIFDVNKLFSNMVFSITSIEGEGKDKLYELIEGNGGKVLSDGFNELVTYSSDSNGQSSFVSNGLLGYKFGAMISNKVCRSAKYLQALALGWPILSESFIFDCVKDHSRLKQWPIYLLPAGQSSFLNAIKSSDIYNFRVNFDQGLYLDKQLENNITLLQNVDVIFVTNKASDTSDISKFVFHSFGVSSIVYCTTQTEVMQELQRLGKQNEKEIMIYDDSKTIRKNLTLLQKKSAPSLSSTRLKSKVGQKLQNSQLDKIRVKLINWEWVVQCVISSFIWDAPTFVINI